MFDAEVKRQVERKNCTVSKLASFAIAMVIAASMALGVDANDARRLNLTPVFLDWLRSVGVDKVFKDFGLENQLGTKIVPRRF